MASTWSQLQAPYNETREDVATMNTEIYGTAYLVAVNVSHLDESGKCVDAPAVTLGGFAWRMRICNTTIIGKTDNLDLSLIADITDPRRFIKAKAGLNLRRAGNADYFDNFLDWKTFSAEKPSHAVTNYLMSRYVNDGKFYFEFDISTKPAKLMEFEIQDVNKTHLIHVNVKQIEEIMEVTAYKLHLTVNNVASLTNETNVRSTEVNLKGIRWYVVAKQDEKNLVISVHAHPDYMSTEWNISAKIDVELILAKNIGRHFRPLKLSNKKPFFKDSPDAHFYMMLWTEVVGPNCDYVLNNTISFTVEIKILNITPFNV